MDIQIYAQSIDVDEIVSLMSDSAIVRKNAVKINDIDIAITGTVFEPHGNGTFIVSEIINENATVSNCPGKLALVFKPMVFRENELYGDIIFTSGY